MEITKELKRRLIIFLSIFSAVALIIGCSEAAPRRMRRAPAISDSGSEAAIRVMPKPWETWREGQDLAGAEILNPLILSGDRYWLSGERREAKKAYDRALKLKDLPERVSEAAALRSAALTLSLDEPMSSLEIISGFMRSTGREVSGASAEFSLVFGFAYGRSGDLEQALAWFGKALDSGTRGRRNLPAEQGARGVIRMAGDSKFNELDRKFKASASLQPIFAEERIRRSRGLVQVGGKSEFAEFWASDDPNSPRETLKPIPPGEKRNIAAFLPLSGRYGSLGASVKNGIELAFEGQGLSDRFSFTVKDSAAGAGPIDAKLTELAVSTAPLVIFGPLLSEEAPLAAAAAQRAQVPLVTFSKSGALGTGDGIFRLAPTTQSQVVSLLDECVDKLHLRRFALVASEDVSGQEFADALKFEIDKRGLELVSQNFYVKQDMESLSSIAQSIESKDVDAIVFTDNPLAGSRFLSALTPVFRQKVKILGSANWDNPNQLDNSRALFNGAIFVSPFVLNSNNPVAQQFVETYTAKYGKKPDFLAAQAFDAATLVLSAMKLDSTRSLEDGLRALDVYDGLTGRIYLGSGGDFTRKMTVVKYEDGAFVPVVDEAGPNSFILRGDSEVNSSGTPRLPTAAAVGVESSPKENGAKG